jgi:L-iditol 2-dehydrogenase
MKALVYTGVEEMAYRDEPHPVPGAGEALVRIMASGICGSDMHAFLGHDERRPAPLILGHEAAGVVVGGADDGRRVTINPLVTCGTCHDCTHERTNLCAKRQIISMMPRPGAFAEYVAMPRTNLITVPDGVSLRHAALAEPIACGWHGVRRGRAALGRTLRGLRTVVIGGGAIGVGAALSLKAAGATDISLIEPNEVRREKLAMIGGFTVLTPDQGKELHGTADLIIDGVGFAATRASACALARPGGVIVHIGLGESTGGLDIRRMTLQEITFIGTYTYTAKDFVETATAIFDGSLGSLDWVETRPLSTGQSAFADIRSGKVAAPKIILIPEHEE